VLSQSQYDEHRSGIREGGAVDRDWFGQHVEVARTAERGAGGRDAEAADTDQLGQRGFLLLMDACR